jgi:hypothetical protein
MKEFDEVLIASIVLEINEKFKRITPMIPKEKEHLLKNLAAAAIHVALFMRDLAFDEKTPTSKHEEVFLNECGCEEFK